MAKRIGPEAKIITLFAALPDESKRIVFDILKSRMTAPRSPKSTAPSAAKKSSRSAEGTKSTVNTEGGKVSALAAGGSGANTITLPDDPTNFLQDSAA